MYINIADDDNLRILEFFGLKTDECPNIRYIVLGDDMIKYKPTTVDLTAQGIKQFTQDVLDGKLKVLFLVDYNPHTSVP